MEWSFTGTLNKENKKVFDNISKLRKADCLFVFVRSKALMVDFVSLGRSDTHHFILSVQEAEGNNTLSRVDLETFKIVLQQIRMNMHFEFSHKNNQIHLETQVLYEDQINAYQYTTKSTTPALSYNQSDEDALRTIISLPHVGAIFELEFRHSAQFKLLAQQIRALKIQRVAFDLLPEQSAIRLQSVYETDNHMVLRYVFNDFKIKHSSIKEQERFCFDAQELLNTIGMLDKDNQLSFILMNTGSLILTETSAIYNSKSILQRIIVHNDF